MQKIPVAILGATGAVGQRLVALLSDHPQFVIAQLSASEKSWGQPYQSAAHRLSPWNIPSTIAQMIIAPPEPVNGVRYIFSALPEAQAREIEPEFRRLGRFVFSASSAHRMNPEVPLLAAQVNLDHLSLIANQLRDYGGFIAAKPNCAVVGLTASLQPLAREFGLVDVTVQSLQSISGGGYPGVSAWDVFDNLLPLPSEEEKIESEVPKVLGQIAGHRIESLNLSISARCLRVPVLEGHTLAVTVKLAESASREAVLETWDRFGRQTLPSASALNAPAIAVLDHPMFPQPRLHRELNGGMTCAVGSLRRCKEMHWQYLAVTHNTMQGAAGGLVLIAECAKAQLDTWEKMSI